MDLVVLFDQEGHGWELENPQPLLKQAIEVASVGQFVGDDVLGVDDDRSGVNGCP